jgi:hypothetical protein
MPKYLKHRVNGVVYPFNEAMSKNPAMELIDEPDPQFAVAANAKKNAKSVETLPKGRKKRATKAEMREQLNTDNTPDEAA